MSDAKKALKEAKKEQRAQKRAKRRQTWSQVWQAFQMQRKQDKALVPLMLAAILGTGLAGFLLGLLWGGEWMTMVVGLMLGLTLAMLIFSRRLQASVYDRASDQRGAAGWALENLKSNFAVAWRTKTAVAMNTHMDLVHRVTGVCGFVLVGEGEPHRLKPLMEQQRKRLNRLAPGVPVHTLFVGEGEDQTPLKNLQKALVKLPRVYKKDEVYQIAGRVEAMDNVAAQQSGLPKGPLPKGGKVSGMNRRARRNAERKGQ